MRAKMQDEWRKYLKDIGLSNTLQSRAAKIFGEFSSLFPQEVTGIFVTDRIDKEGHRRYDSLWFLSNDFLMESKNFGSSDNIDMIRHSRNIVYLTIEKEHYNLRNVNDKSRLTVMAKLSETLGAEFRATRNNCPVLREVVKKHLLPGFVGFAKE